MRFYWLLPGYSFGYRRPKSYDFICLLAGVKLCEKIAIDLFNYLSIWLQRSFLSFYLS